MRPSPLLNRPLPAPGVHIDIIKTVAAKGLGINMPAAAAPHVELSAILAKGALAAVAVDDSIVFLAYFTYCFFFDDYHNYPLAGRQGG
jgi:hypothetical protein